MSLEKNPHTRPLCGAHFVDFENDVLTVESAHALPPGSRISLSLSLVSSSEPLALHGKVLRVEPPRAQGLPRLVVRLHSLTKEQRAALSQKGV